MLKRIRTRVLVTLSLIGILTLAFDVQPVESSGTIYIRADGSIDPPTTPISTVDNVTYVFTDNIYDEIVVERSNIIIDGASHTVQCFGTGFYLSGINNVTIKNTNIKNSHYGISLDYSSNNTISNNNVTNNDYGIGLDGSSDNKFYHNNFVDNTQQVYFLESGYANSWDNGFEGNYWSNYTGVDSDHDGIGESPHVLDADNEDNYPLMGMFSDFNATSEYHVQTICNSTISDFQFNGTAISFNASGENGTSGFCRICVPTTLMNDTCKVFVNGTEIPHTLLPCSNSTHNYLYFTYNHSTQEVIIIPEFPSLLILRLFMIATLLAVIVYRRKHAV